MANHWFQFKQFRIEQDQCAMKVSTDACIQGAWTAGMWKANCSPPEDFRILDIGTGTGLLALMMAQTFPNARIDAAELEPGAALQAAHNFQQSDWLERLHLYPLAIHQLETTAPYPFIICNPPFFNHDLRNTNPERTVARHDDLLTKQDLAIQVNRLLSAEGAFSVMYPAAAWSDWQVAAAAQGLYLWMKLAVIPKPGMAANRFIALYKKTISPQPQCRHLEIYTVAGTYSKAFSELMKAYYLNELV